MEIKYVPKKEIYPAFGFCDSTGIKVRDDLPGIVKEFVLEHETYHYKDIKHDAWYFRELRANSYAAYKHPLGFVATLIMSLAPYRLAYYWQRIKKHG